MRETPPVKPYDSFQPLWGIVNPSGDFWSHNVFRSPEEALAYVGIFWGGDETKTRGFSAVPVRVTLTDARPLALPKPQDPAP